MITLPAIALSVRQPWAWAIVAGHKDVENRSTFAVTKGGMNAKPVAIHAAKGMTRDEYEDAADFMASLGVHCPRPEALVRGAIVGAATVTAVVKASNSPWFFGPRGLVMADAYQTDPIPAAGALGYFQWRPGGALAQPLPWMLAWPRDAMRRQEQTKPGAPAMPLFTER